MYEHIYIQKCICIHFLIALFNRKAKKQRALDTPNSQILVFNTITNTEQLEFFREINGQFQTQAGYIESELVSFFFVLKNKFFIWGISQSNNNVGQMDMMRL